jgi:hypothetical protein
MLRGLIRRAVEHGRTHAAVAVNTGGTGKHTAVSSVSVSGGGAMKKDEDERSEVSEEELERQKGEELPERTQMSVVKIPGDTLPVLPPELD